MRLVAHAWRLRESARDALANGAVDRARDLVLQAERLQPTPQGERLRMLADWLVAVELAAPERPPHG